MKLFITLPLSKNEIKKSTFYKKVAHVRVRFIYRLLLLNAVLIFQFISTINNCGARNLHLSPTEPSSNFTKARKYYNLSNKKAFYDLL